MVEWSDVSVGGECDDICCDDFRLHCAAVGLCVVDLLATWVDVCVHVCVCVCVCMCVCVCVSVCVCVCVVLCRCSHHLLYCDDQDTVPHGVKVFHV